MAIIKQFDKRSGITYVYESKSYWDKEKKQSRAKRTLIGKIDEKTGEMVPTDGRMRNAKKKGKTVKFNPKNVTNKHFGSTYLLQSIAHKVHLIDDLKRIFPQHYQVLLDLAYFLVLAPTNAMRQVENWSHLHHLFSNTQLTSQFISKIFQEVTENKKQSFFRKRINRLDEDEFWCYDTTTISSYSQTLPYIQFGFNKEHDQLPQLNLAYVYSEKTRLPIMYRPLTGSVPDVKTLPWLFGLFDGLERKNIRLVMDRGFYSQENVVQLCQENMTFILGSKLSLKYVQNAINSVIDDLDDYQYYLPSYALYAREIHLKSVFPASKTSYYPVSLHVYYDPQRASEERMALDGKLKQWEELLRKKPEVFDDIKQIRRYFVLTNNGYQLIKEAVENKKRQAGYFVLLSNSSLTSEEVLRLYRNKDVVEKNFENIKDRMNMRRTRVSSEQSLEGKLFVQHIALILIAYIKREMALSGLNKSYTIDDVLCNLDQIYGYWDDSFGFTLGEVLSKHEQIYEGLKITPPR